MTGARTPLPRETLEWLRYEVESWQRADLVTAENGAAILDRYAPATPAQHAIKVRQFSIARLFGGLGAAFVGVGLIWLVAANIDQLPPWARFALVTAIWLGLLFGSEWYAARRTSPLTGGMRLLAALAFGAVVFQAAQSLQVPAYSPWLVGVWALGSLTQAYLLRAMGPLLIGVLTLNAWILMDGLWNDPSYLNVVVLLSVTGLVMVTAASVHDALLPRFAWPWRYLGFAMGLAGLFAAGIPFIDAGRFQWTWSMVFLAGTAVLNLGWVALRGTRVARWETIGAVAVVVVAYLLAIWQAPSDKITLESWAHAGLAVVAYVGLAVGVAVMGTLRDSPLLVAMAAAALVVFTTFQSFAVFARIIQGAWLFLVLGLVFLGTAWLFDRARRSIAAQLDDDPSTLASGSTLEGGQS